MWVILLAVAAASPCDGLPQLRVRLAAEATPSVDLKSAVVDLRSKLGVVAGSSDHEDLQQSIGELEQVCALRASISPAAAPDPARVKAILDRAEFAHARERAGDALERWIQRALDWLIALFETRQADSYSRVTRFLVLALGVSLALFGLWRVRRRAPRTAQTVGLPRMAFALDEPDEHLRRARQCVDSDPRQALREGLLGLLSELERRRFARPDRTKTNRELGAELPARGAPSEMVSAIAAAMAWYDRAFYSLQSVSPDDARSFLSRVEGLRSLPAVAAP